MMRVVIDANVLISFLLSPAKRTIHARILQAAFEGQYQLVVGATTIAEVTGKVQRKPWLRDRIAPEALGLLLQRLSRNSEIYPESRDDIPKYGRDRKDDYLIALALDAAVDIIVSGDKNLLVLDPIGDIRVLSPAVFMAFIDASKT